MPVIRTTYHGRLATMRANNRRVASQLARVQEQAATGLRVARASDDPGITQRLAQLREQLDDQSVYAENANWAMSLLDRADGALTEIADSLVEAREMAVQMSSETYTDTERQRMVTVASGLLARALESANAEFGGRYVFAGEAYDSPAFDTAGNYLGDTGVPDVPVSDTLDVTIGWDGSDLLQGTNDIMAAFSNLVTNLTTGTAAAVQTSLVEIEDAITQLSEARTRVGNEYLIADDALDLTVTLDIELSAQLSRDTEVDAAETYSRLYEVQAAFEAALQVTANARTNLLFSRI